MNIHDYNLGIFEPIIIFGSVLILVNFIAFMRAWSMDTMSTKNILKFLLKMDVAIIISGVFLALMANLTYIASLFK